MRYLIVCLIASLGISCVKKTTEPPPQTVIVPSERTSQGSERLALAGSAEGFEKFQAFSLSQPLWFKMQVHPECSPRFSCKLGQAAAGPCMLKEPGVIEVPTLLRSRGYQNLRITAICASGFSTNPIELSWYNVSPDYQALALRKTTIGNLSIFQLEKRNDCQGKLGYVCQQTPEGEKTSCSNAFKDLKTKLTITAECLLDDGSKVVGPTYQN